MSAATSDHARALVDVRRALEGIDSWQSQPDGYCLCGKETECYLHGVTIPKALDALRSLTAIIEGGRRV